MGIFAGPGVIEDGLVLALDAANLKGYDKYENLVKNSETFENWTANGSRATITTNQIVAPDGSLTADMIEDANSDSGFKNLYQYITITSTETYTASLYVKAGTSDWANFYFDDTNVSFQFSTETILLDPNSGNLGGTGTATAGFDNLGNGWYRLYLKDIYASSGSRPFGIWTGAGTQTYNPSYVGDPTKNFYIWGAQLERGSSVTDYYATTSTAKTRGTTWTDLSIGGGNNGTLVNGPTYSSSNRGSIVFDGTNDYVSVSNSSSLNSSTNTLICWAKSNTATWNEYGFLMSKREVFVMHPNINSTNVSYYYRLNNAWLSQSITVNNIQQWNMYACSWDGTTLSAYLNGNLINSGVKTGPLNTADTGVLEIGRDDGIGSRVFNGNIAQVSIYNRALTATEIQKNFNAQRGRFGI